MVSVLAGCRWKHTATLGWTPEDTKVGRLNLGLMKLGIGQRIEIVDTGLLPSKATQQLNGQTQRMVGQQAPVLRHGQQAPCSTM
jgi:hypothetical protein